jgi:hypothetical protein
MDSTAGKLPVCSTVRARHSEGIASSREPIAMNASPLLAAHHLRFSVRATDTIVFNEFKGSALRGSFASHLSQAFCPAARQAGPPDPLHQALCPACQLLALDGESGGDTRRPYAIEPPLEDQTVYEAGEKFEFGMALYGSNLAHFPYLVLTVRGMGEQQGVGRLDRQAGHRGRFCVEAIRALNPLNGQEQLLYTPDRPKVQMPAIPVTGEQVVVAATDLARRSATEGNRLTVRFLTPTRIVHGQHTLKEPAFFPFFKQVVLRVLDLCAQHGEGRPAVVLKRDLYPHADRVQLVENHTRWWDVQGYSGRLGRSQVLGGLVGTATYTAPDWQPLLPWLLWGVSTHVGKNIVKGCGWYELAGNS